MLELSLVFLQHKDDIEYANFHEDLMEVWYAFRVVGQRLNANLDVLDEHKVVADLLGELSARYLPFIYQGTQPNQGLPGSDQPAKRLKPSAVPSPRVRSPLPKGNSLRDIL